MKGDGRNDYWYKLKHSPVCSAILQRMGCKMVMDRKEENKANSVLSLSECLVIFQFGTHYSETARSQSMSGSAHPTRTCLLWIFLLQCCPLCFVEPHVKIEMRSKEGV